MVYQVEMQRKSCREVGENLNVNASTVCRTVALFNDTGTVDKRKHPPNSGTAVLTDIDKLIIIETISERPDIYLREITEVLVS